MEEGDFTKKIPKGWQHINLRTETAKIDKATENYKNVYYQMINKCKYLPDHLIKHSLSLKREPGYNYTIFDKYYRGTLVYVEFGVNMGSEICGNHLALTLDNIDKKAKRTISVLPLSSKSKPYYIKLPINIFGIAEINISNTMTKYSTEEIFELSDEISKIRNRYKRYDSNQSFACINMIQTISKEKINRMNRFDPSGNMIAPPEIMNLIDQAIIKEYLNIDNYKEQ
ncbi:type II toxin-antitoxin system PemK/MazF family toxin [Ignavigranum ruoffiae]|uniref:type II toxin-antitoxin system PemK/MazF family toxin n=1 Tax=Ignavigranum ruoffiae TaxID=89093 RepID=UPI00206C8E57|nr:type II toxin-antitoxin system PemK/MazF family toxin [Ignavigranum ruoffiae]UPQ86048.1 type II toxin-antitoxin system PemK/MazF family toxin [Ignavigranum ruoffiae]